MNKIFNIFQIYGDGDDFTSFKLIGNAKTIEGAYNLIINFIEDSELLGYKEMIEQIKLQDNCLGTVFVQITSKYDDGRRFYELMPEMKPENNFAVINTRKEIIKSLNVSYCDNFNGFLIEAAELFD